VWQTQVNAIYVNYIRCNFSATLCFFSVTCCFCVCYGEVRSEKWEVRSEEWGVRSEEWGVRSEKWEVRSEKWEVRSGEEMREREKEGTKRWRDEFNLDGTTARKLQMARLCCQNLSTSQVHSSLITHYALRITHYALRITTHHSPFRIILPPCPLPACRTLFVAWW